MVRNKFAEPSLRDRLPPKFKTDEHVVVVTAILQFIRAHAGGVSLGEVVQHTSQSALACNEYLNALLRAGEVERVKLNKVCVYGRGRGRARRGGAGRVGERGGADCSRVVSPQGMKYAALKGRRGMPK